MTALRRQAADAVPRIGFLGTGWIGLDRMKALKQSAIAEAAAIADPDPAMLAAALSHAPQAEAAASFEDLLAAGLDGIVIATPSALHAEQSIAALEAGLAVFCQKPLGRTAAEVEAVVAAARRADRLLDVDLSYRHTAGMRRIKEIVDAGQLGRIFSADLVFHNAYGPDKPWFYDPALSGGGCLIDLGTHLVDLALWVLDFPPVAEISGRLHAKGRTLSKAAEAVEDHATATITLESGAEIRIACSWNLHAGQDADIRAVFHGTEGGAAFRNIGGSFYDFTAERFAGTGREVLAEPPDAWGGQAIIDWAGRLARDNGFDPQIARHVETARILDSIYGRLS